MKKTTQLTLFFLLATGLVSCSKTAEVTWHKLCDSKTKLATQDFTVPLYAEPDSKSQVVETVKVGTVVRVFEHKNHNVWAPKNFIRVQTATNEGYMSPKCFVVNQNPAESVWRYSKGLVQDYKYFYDPSDKTHYPKGYTYKELDALSKERLPLSQLAPELGASEYEAPGVLKPNGADSL